MKSEFVFTPLKENVVAKMKKSEHIWSLPHALMQSFCAAEKRSYNCLERSRFHGDNDALQSHVLIEASKQKMCQEFFIIKLLDELLQP